MGRGGAGPDESQGAKHFAKRYDVDRRPDPHPRFLAIYLFLLSSHLESIKQFAPVLTPFVFFFNFFWVPQKKKFFFDSFLKTAPETPCTRGAALV